MRRFFLPIFIVIFTGALTACGTQPTSSPPPQPTPTSPLIALLPSSTPSEPAPSLLLLLPTPQLVKSMEAAVRANSIVRNGPGMLFDVVTTIRLDQQVVVTGQAPGGNWVYVDNGSQSGWVNSELVTLSGSANQLRTIDPLDALVIKGHIYTPNGSPAYGIGVSLLRKLSNDTPQVDAAFSNDAGEWYLFLPASESGTWAVRPDIYRWTSNAVNKDGDLIGHFPDPQQVTLPLPAGTWVDFSILP